ncbi:MAG: phosphotransferase [Candidatus Binatia bacterium]
MTAADYPRDPGAVTPRWLADTLRTTLPGLPAIESFAGSTIGTGQVGQCIRFDLQYAAEPSVGSPFSVVGKFASADPASRAAGQAGRCYVSEVGFYRDLQVSVGIRTPRCYFAAIDDSEVDHALILEDMSPASQGDQIAGCTPAEAAAALEELARLHAPRWNDSGLQELAWLGGASAERAELVCPVYDSFLEGFAERYGDRLDDDTLRLARDMSPALPRLLSEATGPQTIVHRDYRLDNMLFGDGVTAPRVSVVDWQTVGLGAGPSDAAYFIGAGLPTELRREHERDLFGVYHEALVAGGVDDYGRDDCWREYRRATIGGLLMAVMASMMVGVTERGDEMFMTMAKRHAVHAIDLHAREFF